MFLLLLPGTAYIGSGGIDNRNCKKGDDRQCVALYPACATMGPEGDPEMMDRALGETRLLRSPG